MSRSDERPRRHAPLVGLLTFTSGCVDVVTLMVLGGAFTSVITGNLIFIGRAIGTSSLDPALHATMAVAGYVAGVALGSRLRQFASARLGTPLGTPPGTPRPARAAGPHTMESQAAWPPAATLVLTVESAILVALNIAWIGAGANPPTTGTDLMLTAAALALGLQGAAARGIAGNPSTTYMTGALTALVEALSTGGRRTADLASVAGLITLVAGAACSALLVEHARPVALVLPLMSLLLVIAIKLRDHRAERRAVGRRPRAAPKSLYGTVPWFPRTGKTITAILRTAIPVAMAASRDFPSQMTISVPVSPLIGVRHRWKVAYGSALGSRCNAPQMVDSPGTRPKGNFGWYGWTGSAALRRPEGTEPSARDGA